jgi:hypothetical protein
MYIARAMEGTVRQISATFPVLLVTGPRQVGKTTMLQALCEETRRYVTLDDPLLRELAVADPALFLQRFEPPALIDEIQYAPELLPHIKMRVDQHRRSGDFWLTGSQMFHLMKGASESLAGRVGIVNLLGLSNSEISGRTSVPFTGNPPDLTERAKTAEPLSLSRLFKLIFRGGMPALYANDVSTDIFFSSYLQTYLQRDVRDLAQVGNELSFVRFLSSVAARTGQLVNYADMARDAGISPPTAKQWLSILVSSGIVCLVEPYFNNVLKRTIKAPKLYVLDTGLCAYLTKWTTPETLEAGAMSGAFFETWVVAEILKSYLNAGKRPPLYYYRDRDKREIDLVLNVDDRLYPVEIKLSSNPGRQSVRSFKALADSGLSVGPGSVICLTNDLLPVDRQNWYVPAWLI